MQLPIIQTLYFRMANLKLENRKKTFIILKGLVTPNVFFKMLYYNYSEQMKNTLFKKSLF